MARLVADLLDVSRLESGGLPLETAPVDSRALIYDAVDLLTPAATSRGLDLRIDAPADLPPVQADRSRIQQVLANLVGNAIKFTPAGGQVVVRAAPRDDEVVFAGSDTGEGIAPDHLPRIFDRFWQASKAKRGGAGLGLAIVDGIVRAHGGAVGVESTPGTGSTFSFSIPAAAPDGM